MTEQDTQKFTVPNDDRENMRRILRTVYEALTEKGYNPINQIVGYLLTEDPTYITNYNNAQGALSDRDFLAMNAQCTAELEAAEAELEELTTQRDRSPSTALT